MMLAGKCMELDIIMLSEINRFYKDMFSLVEFRGKIKRHESKR
jgi:hypothetical protein